MPIYAYRCESCGFEKAVLQKMSDAPLTQCPQCLNDTFRKQVTAAGFQLKGSGWYVTDFRGGSNAKGAASNNGENANANGDGAAKSDTPSTDSASPAATSTGADAPAATSPAAATPSSASST